MGLSGSEKGVGQTSSTLNEVGNLAWRDCRTHVNEKSSMRNVHPRKLEFHQTPNGREPFTEWFESIQDQETQNRIQKWIDRLALGNFGDYRTVGDGVLELRIHVGAGYRVYFGEVDNTIVLLLCGRDKSSQARDIERAKTYWLEYKETQQ